MKHTTIDPRLWAKVQKEAKRVHAAALRRDNRRKLIAKVGQAIEKVAQWGQ